MKRKFAPSVFLFFFLCFHARAFDCSLPDHFEFSVSNESGTLLYRGCYDAANRGPRFTEYVLTKETAESAGVRRPSVNFSQDRDGGALKRLLEENGFSLPRHSDFTNSGYDRGHMAPNADFNGARENAVLTFFIGNVWPQAPEVNRVSWLAAENETRRLASEHSEVKVVITVDEFSGEEISGISVPSSFKRAVFDSASGEILYEISVPQSLRPLDGALETEDN